MTDSFTIDELLAALTQAQAQDTTGDSDGAYTVRELGAMMPGRSQNYIRELLRTGIAGGTVEVTRIMATRIDGLRVPVSAYRLIRGDDNDSTRTPE